MYFEFKSFRRSHIFGNISFFTEVLISLFDSSFSSYHVFLISKVLYWNNGQVFPIAFVTRILHFQMKLTLWQKVGIRYSVKRKEKIKTKIKVPESFFCIIKHSFFLFYSKNNYFLVRKANVSITKKQKKVCYICY